VGVGQHLDARNSRRLRVLGSGVILYCGTVRILGIETIRSRVDYLSVGLTGLILVKVQDIEKLKIRTSPKAKGAILYSGSLDAIYTSLLLESGVRPCLVLSRTAISFTLVRKAF
jgi:hypothetical protein